MVTSLPTQCHGTKKRIRPNCKQARWNAWSNKSFARPQINTYLDEQPRTEAVMTLVLRPRRDLVEHVPQLRGVGLPQKPQSEKSALSPDKSVFLCMWPSFAQIRIIVELRAGFLSLVHATSGLIGRLGGVFLLAGLTLLGPGQLGSYYKLLQTTARLLWCTKYYCDIVKY